MKLNQALALAVCMVVVLGAVGHTAEDVNPIAFSLTGMEGLREISVLVETMEEDFKRTTGLSEQGVRTHVELYLRKVPGLEVVDGMQAIVPRIYVNINGRVETTDSGYRRGVYGSLDVGLTQSVYLNRSMPSSGKSILVVGAKTWQSGAVFTGRTDHTVSEFLMKGISQALDEFQNEYLKANPDVKP